MTAPCIPRQRKRTAKVKTGCWHCKRRRIKCGEQRPACERCARAGLICTYDTPASSLHQFRDAAKTLLFQAWEGGAGSALRVNMPMPPSARVLDADKAIYVERYGHCVAPILSRIGSADFWFRTVLRDVKNDDCILHCVIAIGALEYALDARQIGAQGSALIHKPNMLDQPRTKIHYERALKSMNLAISLMKVQIQQANEETPRRTMLIVSILLAVFELMHGEPKSADKIALKAMVTLQDSLPLYRPDLPSCEAIGREVDDEGINEAEWLLPRLVSMQGGVSGLPLDLQPRRCDWESDPCLSGLLENISCPGLDVTHEAFMRRWDRYLTVQMFWQTRINPASVTDAERALLHKQHSMILSMASEWWHTIPLRIAAEPDLTRQLILKVTLFFSTVAGTYLLYTLLPGDLTWESNSYRLMYALDIAEQILDETGHESSFLLFNDKILPSIPALLQRCSTQEVQTKGLTLMAKALTMMEREKKGGRTPPRNMWLKWWWTSTQLRGHRQWLTVGNPLIKQHGDGSPQSSTSDHSISSEDSKDEVYRDIANQICQASLQDLEGSQSGNAAHTTEYENLVLSAIATCTI